MQGPRASPRQRPDPGSVPRAPKATRPVMLGTSKGRSLMSRKTLRSAKARATPPLLCVGLAVITLGCTANVSPAPTDSGPAQSSGRASAVASEAASDGGVSLPPPPPLDPEGIRLSCGSPLDFDAEALRGPTGVETSNHPAAEALRRLQSEDRTLSGRHGWQVAVLTDSSALFLFREPTPDAEPSHWSAEFERRDGQWTWVRYGQCDIQPVFEGLETARWELAPGQQLTPDSRTFEVLVTEQGCSSGQGPEGRIVPAAAIYLETSITVIFAVRPLPGAQTCQGAPPASVTLELDEPLGDRQLLDGSVIPAEPRGGPP